MFNQYRPSSDEPACDQQINELYYIVPIANLQHILQNGILSHRRATPVPHVDVANQGVQANQRAHKILERVKPQKSPRSIHRHAVLYMNPHNAMMANMMENGNGVCVLRVHKSILNRGDAVFSDRNAAITNARFFTRNAYRLAPELTAPLSLKQYCRDEEIRENYKQIRQSEVLLPYKIQPAYLTGIIVGSGQDNEDVQRRLAALNPQNMPIAIVPSMFFLGRHTRIIVTNDDPIDAGRVDLNTVLIQKTGDTLNVFWRYQDGQNTEVRTKNVTGQYKDQVVNLLQDDLEVVMGANTFREILYKCGANCRLEQFPVVAGPDIAPSSPESSDSEDEGPITRLNRGI